MSLVMIIEDEPTIARILQRKFSRKGFDVVCKETIEGAKIALKTKSPDILFLDFVLKDGRATDLLDLDEMKKINKIVVMSAFIEEIDRRKFSELDIFDFIVKPFDDIDGVIEKTINSSNN